MRTIVSSLLVVFFASEAYGASPDPPMGFLLMWAWAVMALSVGGLMLSRAVDDEKLSHQILAACRTAADEI